MDNSQEGMKHQNEWGVQLRLNRAWHYGQLEYFALFVAVLLLVETSREIIGTFFCGSLLLVEVHSVNFCPSLTLKHEYFILF